MSEAKQHTRGPWDVVGTYIHGDRSCLAAVWNQRDGSEVANAKLMAAAPALLAVCQAVVAECEATFVDPAEMAPEWVTILHDARAALSAAETEKEKHEQDSE